MACFFRAIWLPGLLAVVSFVLCVSIAAGSSEEHAWYSHSLVLGTKFLASREFTFQVRETPLTEWLGLKLYWTSTHIPPEGDLVDFDCRVRISPKQFDVESLTCATGNNSVWTWARWHLQMSQQFNSTGGDPNITSSFVPFGHPRPAGVVASSQATPNKKNGGVKVVVQFQVNDSLEVVDRETGVVRSSLSSSQNNSLEEVNWNDSMCIDFQTTDSCVSQIGRCIWILDFNIGCVSTNSSFFLRKNERGSITYTLTAEGDIRRTQYVLNTFQGTLRAEMNFRSSTPVTSIAAAEELMNQFIPVENVFDDFTNKPFNEAFGARRFKRKGVAKRPRIKNRRGLDSHEGTNVSQRALLNQPKSVDVPNCVFTGGDSFSCVRQLVDTPVLFSRMRFTFQATGRIHADEATISVQSTGSGTFEWMGLRMVLLRYDVDNGTATGLFNDTIPLGTIEFNFGPATIHFELALPLKLGLDPYAPCSENLYCFDSGPKLQVQIVTEGSIIFGWKQTFHASPTIVATGEIADVSLPVKMTVGERKSCGTLFYQHARAVLQVAVKEKLCSNSCIDKTLWQDSYLLSNKMKTRDQIRPKKCVVHTLILPATPVPTFLPSTSPTTFPSRNPITTFPSSRPTPFPTTRPSKSPTKLPTRRPVITKSPTPEPSLSPTGTLAPTSVPQCFSTSTSQQAFATSLYATISPLIPTCPPEYAFRKIRLRSSKGTNSIVWAWWEYDCCPFSLTTETWQLQTGPQTVSAKNSDMRGFVGKDINCRERGGLLQTLELHYDTDNNTFFEYGCAKPSMRLRCTGILTSRTAVASSSLQMVSQHDIICPETSPFIQRLIFQNPTASTLQVLYRCCSLG